VRVGLTVYYTLLLPKSAAPAFPNALDALGKLREYCIGQDFCNVSTIDEFDSEDRGNPEDEAIEQLVFGQWTQLLFEEGKKPPEEAVSRDIMPSRAARFLIHPAEGCESASFGVSDLPAEIQGYPTVVGSNWYWRSFCKTQYVSVHSIEKFIEVHRALIRVFDCAVAIGFDVDVRDDGSYWETRDEAVLVEKIGHMNRMVARVAGAFKDVADEQDSDGRVAAPIFGHPQFERLEAEAEGEAEIMGERDNGKAPE
jgi:hypothetical protein